MIHTITDDNNVKWLFDDDQHSLMCEGSEDISEYGIASFFDAMLWLRDNDYVSHDTTFTYNNTRQFLINKLSAEMSKNNGDL